MPVLDYAIQFIVIQKYPHIVKYINLPLPLYVILFQVILELKIMTYLLA